MKKHIPNSITLLNLIAGCLSAIFLLSGDVILSAWMIGLAAVFDFLDGLAARVLKATSPIGKILDSLADMVSFGLVPGLIIFRMIRMDTELPDILAYVSLLIPALSAIRLAIFSAEERDHEYFTGVPTPLNALLLASVPLILWQYRDNTVVYSIFSNTWFLVALTILSSLMLVAPVRIMALKFKTFAWPENRITYLLIFLFIILLILAGYLALPVIYLLYIILSLSFNEIRKAGNY